MALVSQSFTDEEMISLLPEASEEWYGKRYCLELKNEAGWEYPHPANPFSGKFIWFVCLRTWGDRIVYFWKRS